MPGGFGRRALGVESRTQRPAGIWSAPQPRVGERSHQMPSGAKPELAGICQMGFRLHTTTGSQPRERYLRVWGTDRSGCRGSAGRDAGNRGIGAGAWLGDSRMRGRLFPARRGVSARCILADLIPGIGEGAAAWEECGPPAATWSGAPDPGHLRGAVAPFAIYIRSIRQYVSCLASDLVVR